MASVDQALDQARFVLDHWLQALLRNDESLAVVQRTQKAVATWNGSSAA